MKGAAYMRVSSPKKHQPAFFLPIKVIDVGDGRAGQLAVICAGRKCLKYTPSNAIYAAEHVFLPFCFCDAGKACFFPDEGRGRRFALSQSIGLVIMRACKRWSF